MARIRSIHPGLFTDEGYMGLAIEAKAAWPGIWTEADDHGVFEWKPITLKAKILPYDNVDMVTILANCVDRGLLIQFIADGKQYGVIKGFLRWQRPREPSYRYPFPQEAETFSKNNGSPAVALPQDDDTPPEKSAQREEEGGKREEVGGKDSEMPNGIVACATGEDVRQGFALFNDAAKRTGWPEAQQISDDRKKLMRARLKDVGGIEGFAIALGKAEASDFLTTTWPNFNLDWMLKPKNFRKLMEGNYDKRIESKSGPARDGIAADFAAAADLLRHKQYRGI